MISSTCASFFSSAGTARSHHRDRTSQGRTSCRPNADIARRGCAPDRRVWRRTRRNRTGRHSPPAAKRGPRQRSAGTKPRLGQDDRLDHHEMTPVVAAGLPRSAATGRALFLGHARCASGEETADRAPLRIPAPTPVFVGTYGRDMISQSLEVGQHSFGTPGTLVRAPFR